MTRLEERDVSILNNTEQEILEWLEDNLPFIDQLYYTLEGQRTRNYLQFDQIYHQTITDQFKELFISIMGIACCRDIGCSIEDFLIVLEDEVVYNELIERIRSNDL